MKTWICVAFLLSGCASLSFAPGEEPEYLVSRMATPFYHYGPQQPGGPDEYLDLGERVLVTRQEFGFSFVQRWTGVSGYVANENIEQAPPSEVKRAWEVASVMQAELPSLHDRATPTPKPSTRKKKPYRGPPVEVPLPEEPDLEVQLPDAPPVEVVLE